MFNKVFIIGTGLIGGSLGLALKRKGLAKQVVGLSRLRKNLCFAKKIGAIDKIALSLDEAKNADLIVLALPVDLIIKVGEKIAKLAPKDCLVIDVGSTKQEIVLKLDKLFSGFVGCHPLAGSEKSGILSADADLFNKSSCILTPTGNTQKAALKRAALMWKSLGAKTIFLSPLSHDRILSFTSHLPHVAAFSLIAAVPPVFLKISSGGLKDTTRIASSDASLWSNIFLSNRVNLIKAIGDYQKNLTVLKSALIRKDRKDLLSLLSKSQRRREELK